MKPKLSLIKQIESYMKMHRRWVHGEDIARYAQSIGYESETGRRRLRQLMSQGKVETQSRKGVRVRSNWYRYVAR